MSHVETRVPLWYVVHVEVILQLVVKCWLQSH